MNPVLPPLGGGFRDRAICTPVCVPLRGRLCADKGAALDIRSDKALAKRQGRWEALQAGELIVGIWGSYCTGTYIRFLSDSLSLRTSFGRVINVVGENLKQIGKNLQLEKQQNSLRTRLIPLARSQ